MVVRYACLLHFPVSLMLLSGCLEGLVVRYACLLRFPVSLILLSGWLEGLVVRCAHMHTHTHTQAPAHMSILTIQSLIYTT